MLVVASEQLAHLDAESRRGFAAALHDHLCARRPDVLPRFPPPVREAVVRNMVARAGCRGLTWTSAITLYCDLMQSLSPAFDRHPAVAKALDEGHATADARMRSLVARLPAAVWREVAGSRCDLPLYVPPDRDDAPLPDRVAAALPLVLWDRVQPERAAEIARKAVMHADRLGFRGIDDAPLAVAAWRALYPKTGPEPGWTADVLDPRRPPAVRLALLRLRIALDHGRRV